MGSLHDRWGAMDAEQLRAELFRQFCSEGMMRMAEFERIQRLEKRIGEQRQRINQLQDERHEMGIKLAHALAAERAEAMERDRLRAEVVGWRECVLYDAMMDGPRFKGWDRSALDRMRRRAEQDSWIGAIAAAETTPAGATVDAPDALSGEPKAAAEPKIMRTGRANWTWRSECGGAWYISLNERAAAPYLRQIHVEAIVDLDAQGLVAGIEIIDEKMPGPPLGVSAEPKRSE